MASWMNTEDKLYHSYNLLFDVKDHLSEKGDKENRYLAYEAISKVGQLMRALGYTEPQRFDPPVIVEDYT